ncbi:MAG TPA: hypothetical protein PKL85_13320 [Bacteroidia bacterium]|nr:hypothetical protein [Bacteroidia bacterium]
MKTKKITQIFLAMTMFFSFSNRMASAQAFEDGNNNVSIGYGFVTFAGALFNTYEDQNNYNFSITGPIFAKYEHAVSDHIGVGLNFAYAKWKLSYNYESYDANNNAVTYTESDSYSTYSILGRFNLHFGNLDKFDPFWGVGVGYRSGTWKYESNDPYGINDLNISNPIPLGFETTIGARYYFTDNIGVYAETGIAKAVIQAGLNFKF